MPNLPTTSPSPEATTTPLAGNVSSEATKSPTDPATSAVASPSASGEVKEGTAQVEKPSAARQLMDLNAQKAALKKEREALEISKKDVDTKASLYSTYEKDVKELLPKDPMAFFKKYGISDEETITTLAKQRTKAAAAETPTGKLEIELEKVKAELEQTRKEKAASLKAQQEEATSKAYKDYMSELTKAVDPEKHPYITGLGDKSSEWLEKTSLELMEANCRKHFGKASHQLTQADIDKANKEKLIIDPTHAEVVDSLEKNLISLAALFTPKNGTEATKPPTTLTNAISTSATKPAQKLTKEQREAESRRIIAEQVAKNKADKATSTARLLEADKAKLRNAGVAK